MLRIATQHEHSRMSTRELLLKIAAAVAAGETDFHISASGQHDIGGPLWNDSGKPLRFAITNPGQRVGSMCLPGTTVIVEGPAPADVGWLNSGGVIAVRGDAGDTAGHCAASGRIYIGGRAGTRSGSLMKHDPEHEPPQLWVLNSVGSFSFEFMSGGNAVVCGHDSQTLQSVLGDRPCVGMVGGTVYFRGPCGNLPDDVVCRDLDNTDIAWLDAGLDDFLGAVGKEKLKRELSFWKHWRKLVPADSCGKREKISVSSFHAQNWIPGGIFGDVYHDDAAVVPLVPSGENRLATPEWENEQRRCSDCHQCLQSCPQGALRRRMDGESPVYSAAPARCTGCGICQAVCPHSVWRLHF